MKKNTKEKPEGIEEEEALPRWNLNRVYTGAGSLGLAADQRKASELADEFMKTYAGRVARLSGKDLGSAVEKYEEIETILQKIRGYAELLELDDRDNFAKTEPLKKWLTGMEGNLSFFGREIGKMKEADLVTKLAAPGLSRYAPWIAQHRGEGESLPEEIEKACHQYEAANTAAWHRFYHESVSSMKIEHEGEMVSLEDLESRIQSADFSAEEGIALRKKAGELLKKNSRRITLIYNTLVKDTVIDAEMQDCTRADEIFHAHNGLDLHVADTMFETAKASYARLTHRFYAWRAAQKGLTKMKSAALREPDGDNDASYSWDEARRLVLRSFRKFSPRFYRIAQKFFDEARIDAEARDGKNPNAYTVPVVAGSPPFISLHFNGGMGDVVDPLGHELGHGIHQVLAEKARGTLLSDMPVTVSEVASIFAEMLVVEELLASEKDPKVRRSILAEKVENMLLNSLDQLAHYDFERRVHEERKKGELDVERISDIWVETQKEYYGPAIEMDDYDRYYWMVVPHFFETPFYVYSYSFAQLTVSALFQEYKKACVIGPEAQEQFVKNYTELLETGITKSCRDMFEPFGLDPEQPAFWEGGLALIEKYLDHLIDPSIPAPASKIVPFAPKPPAF